MFVLTLPLSYGGNHNNCLLTRVVLFRQCCADSSRPDPSPPSSSGAFTFSNRPTQRPPPPRPSPRPAPPSRPAPRPPPAPSPGGFSDPSCPKFRSPSNCGRSPFSPSRVVNGVPVQSLGDFPWMAALKYTSEPRFKCGGAIVNENWILTAAHCLLDDGP